VTDPRYVDEVLRTLWPGPEGGGTASSSPSSSGASLSLLTLPSTRRPRVVLPSRPWAASAGALRNYRTSATGARRVVARAGSVALRLGLADLLPGRRRVPARDGIHEFLSGVLEREVHVAVYLGPARAIQKPVLQVLDPHGRTIAYAKVAVNELTTRLVDHEADVLQRLTRDRLPGISTPRVLFSGPWRDRQVLVQEALVPTRSGAVSADLLRRATATVARGLGEHREPLVGGDYLTGLASRQASLPGRQVTATLAADLADLVSTPAPELSFGSWHGDWAPWNMGQAGDSLLVWDWEGFRSGVPIGFDACHHFLNDQVTVHSLPVDAAIRALFDARSALLQPLGVPEEVRSWVLRLYLHELATSYVENEEDVVGGTPLSRLDSWLGPALVLARATVRSDRG
jgi:hypothetical protein